ncbi:hypothetical protein INR49_006447 [Caranx melampygus]|nr:hypothetical protein INR49_006447 [Caranx melampygus]
MKLEVKIQLLKFCSGVINCIFMVLGLSVVGCAVWILFGKGNFLTVVSSVELDTVASSLLLIGGVVLMVSVIGCVGTDREHRFLLLVYMGFLIVLVLGQLFVMLLLLINRNKVEQSLEAEVDQIISGFLGSSSEDQLLENVQHYGRCCGRTGPSDWLKNSYLQSVNLSRPDVLPCSCFTRFRRSFNSSFCSELNDLPLPLGRGNSSYQQGCSEVLSMWLQENVLTIVSMDIGMILIQMLQFGLVLNLYRAITSKASLKQSNQLADSDHAHLDHAPTNDLDPGHPNYTYMSSEGGYVDPDDPSYYYDTIEPINTRHLTYHHDKQMYLEPPEETPPTSTLHPVQ